MKIIKAFGIYIAAEIFCLFIGMTLAGSSSSTIRVICAVCTVGILAVLVTNFAARTAQNDLKQERITGEKTAQWENIAAGTVLSLPFAISWVLLKISVTGGKFDFYRWHKLISAPFLQIYNLINPDASSSALSQSEVWGMLPLVFVPAAVFLAVYFLTYKGAVFNDKQN